MFKKFSIPILILLFIISIISAYFYVIKRQLPDFNMIKAIPVDAAMIVESNNMFSTIHTEKNKNQIWNELITIENINKVNNNLNNIDSIISKDEKIKKILKNKKAIISIHNIGKNNVALLFLNPSL